MVRSWSDERDSEGWEAHRARLGFRRVLRHGRPDVDLRRASDDFWVTAMLRRVAGDNGESESLIYGLCWIQTKGREATGGAPGRDGIGWTSGSSILCVINQLGALEGAQGWEKKVRRGEEARGSSWAMNSSGNACRCSRLRREISSALRRFEWGKGGER
jgi:hypothetical protein